MSEYKSRWDLDLDQDQGSTSDSKRAKSFVLKAFRRSPSTRKAKSTSNLSKRKPKKSQEKEVSQVVVEQPNLTNLMLILITEDGEINEVMLLELDLNHHVKKHTFDDLIKLIPDNAKDKFIKNQGYHCVCKRDGTPLKNNFYIVDYFGNTTTDEKHYQVVVPVPYGKTCHDTLKLIQPILNDEQIIELTGVGKNETLYDLNDNKAIIKVHDNHTKMKGRNTSISEITEDSYLENITEEGNESDIDNESIDAPKLVKDHSLDYILPDAIETENKFSNNGTVPSSTEEPTEAAAIVATAMTVAGLTYATNQDENTGADSNVLYTISEDEELGNSSLSAAAFALLNSSNNNTSDDIKDDTKAPSTLSPVTNDDKPIGTTTNATKDTKIEDVMVAAVIPGSNPKGVKDKSNNEQSNKQNNNDKVINNNDEGDVVAAVLISTVIAQEIMEQEKQTDDNIEDHHLDSQRKVANNVDDTKKEKMGIETEENLKQPSTDDQDAKLHDVGTVNDYIIPCATEAGLVAEEVIVNQISNTDHKQNDILPYEQSEANDIAKTSGAELERESQLIITHDVILDKDTKEVSNPFDEYNPNSLMNDEIIEDSTKTKDDQLHHTSDINLNDDDDILAAAIIGNIVIDPIEQHKEQDLTAHIEQANESKDLTMVDISNADKEENNTTHSKIFQIIVVSLLEGTLRFELIEFDIQINLNNTNDNLIVLNLLNQIPNVVKDTTLKKQIYKCLCTGSGIEINNNCKINDCFDDKDIFCAIAVPTHMTCTHCATIVKPFFSDYDIISMVLDSKDQTNFDDTINVKDLNHDVDCRTIMTNQISELTTDLVLPPIQQHITSNNYNRESNVINPNENEDDKEIENDDDDLNSLEIIAMLVISMLYYLWNEITSGNIKRKFHGVLVISIFICLCYWNKSYIMIENM